jgi:phosphate transport system substrate-binding protein
MQLRRLAPPAAALAVLTLAACGSSNNTTSGGGSTPSAAPSSTAGTSTCQTGTITASGSTALQPLVSKAAEQYQAKCPGATITVSGGGSSVGLSNVAAGVSDIGDSDVPVSNAKSIDPSTVTDHQVAVVVFAVIVNPQAGVTALTTAQVQDIFSGTVTNWKDVGGKDIPITLIERKTGSGTRLSFEKIMMGGKAESKTPASTQDSTQLVLQGVAGAPGGVSYVGVSSANSSVVAVTIDGAKPNADDVKSGKYKYFAHEHMYTKSTASPLADSFINFMLTADFQNSTVTQLGYLPVATTSEQSAADQ